MLEAGQHADNCFVTLTYDDAHMPDNRSLNPKHTQDWLKRLRSAASPLRIRFFLAGEYGDETERPHYHAALFGFPGCRSGRSRYRLGARNCCSQCDMVRDTWAQGHIDVGSLEINSAQYICGYVTKKMTRHDDLRLRGRHPEFARMSRRPGLGYSALADIADVLLKHDLVDGNVDVPSTLRVGNRLMPLGRYLRRKLRLHVGMEEDAPIETLQKWQDDMQAVLADFIQDQKNDPSLDPSYKKRLMALDQGRYEQQLARSKIYKQRKTL